jgi:adenylyltransferase/sulfurtransferase
MTLSPAELERYARHIVLQDVGGPGQQKLKAARVLVIGAGGLGAPVLQYLAAAGVGTLGIVDDDTVSLSNLQRQVIHDTDQLGEPKVASAAEAIARLNPHVKVEPHPVRLQPMNALALVSAYDLVVDGSDNFDTRYLVSDACFYAGKPLVSGAVGRLDGSLTLLKPHEKGEDGTPNPTYRCIFPEKPPAGLLPTCAEAGVLGALTGMVGTMQAMEAIKEIAGFGEGLLGRLLLIDARNMRFETIRYRWSQKNPLNGSAPRRVEEMIGGAEVHDESHGEDR